MVPDGWREPTVGLILSWWTEDVSSVSIESVEVAVALVGVAGSGDASNGRSPGEGV